MSASGFAAIVCCMLRMWVGVIATCVIRTYGLCHYLCACGREIAINMVRIATSPVRLFAAASRLVFGLLLPKTMSKTTSQFSSTWHQADQQKTLAPVCQVVSGAICLARANPVQVLTAMLPDRMSGSFTLLWTVYVYFYPGNSGTVQVLTLHTLTSSLCIHCTSQLCCPTQVCVMLLQTCALTQHVTPSAIVNMDEPDVHHLDSDASSGHVPAAKSSEASTVPIINLVASQPTLASNPPKISVAQVCGCLLEACC